MLKLFKIILRLKNIFNERKINDVFLKSMDVIC